MTVRIDETDRKILGELQRDASQSLDDIAKQVGSSKTPEWNRLRKLRDAGVTVVTYSKDEIETMAAAVRADAWPQMKPEIGDELYELIQSHYGK